MKWNETVSLNKTFLPVCDIKVDDGFYWKQFICHNDFYTLLKNTINMYQKKEKSVWLQGTFGSGKTHAATVIKNLFSRDLEEITEYINDSIKEPQVRPTLLSIRNNLKTFPIILKGSYAISDSITFSYAIQQETIKALQEANINETIANSYDGMIDRIRLNAIFWQEVIENSRLIDEVSDIDELIGELGKHNDTLLKLCEEELIKRGMSVITNDIISFLEDAANIVTNYGYDNITLFWDEFTPILEIDKYNDILMMLQNLSENIKNGKVFLFVVAHRTPNKNRILEEDIKKIYDRFELTHYKMEDITTYALLSNSLKKLDVYGNVVDSFKQKDNFNDLIRYVLNQEDNTMNVNNLFEMLPIHPYSGLILSLIARQLQSSNRSIFSFLYANNGFKQFLNEDTDHLMDISYLWDYFLNIFEEDEKLHPYITKYSMSKDIAEINKDYLVVLKAILLLNILNKVIGGNELEFHRILKPSRDNLEHIFRVTKYYEILDSALKLIDKKYIQQDSDGLFLVSSATLPENEVFEEKKRIKDGSYKSIINILKPKESDIKKIFSNGILRANEIYFTESKINAHTIRTYCQNKFKLSYSLKVMVFFALEESEILNIKNILRELAVEYSEIIFVTIENSFTLERYDKFIDYAARDLVAKRHHHENESERSRQQADKILKQYIDNSLKVSSATIYLENDISNGISLNNFSGEINRLSKKIYSSGADSGLVNGYRLWDKQNPSKTIPLNVIKSFDRDELNSNLIGQFKPLINLLKDTNNDYVLHEDFRIKDEYPNHYLVKILQEVENKIKKNKRSGEVNLGKSLKFLTKPPYGLYSNPISFVILSLALKKYDGKFYEIGNGRKIENLLLIEKIVEIFKFFEDKSRAELRVKFGTEEEDKLIEIFKDLFSLEEGLGIAQYTFKIKEWISSAKYPLWVIKYESGNENVNQVIDKLTILINAHDEDIRLDDIKEIVNIIEQNSLTIDLKLLLDKNRFENYFDRFIQSLNLDISKDSYEEIYSHIKSNIRANIDSDIAGWNEDRVKVLILEWHNEKSKPPKIEPPIEPPGATPPSEPPPVPDSEEITRFKNKIKYLNLSLIVMEHVDDDPELYRVLKKYIED